MKVFQDMKQMFGDATKAVQLNVQTVVLRVKNVNVALNELKSALSNIESVVPEVQTTVKDIQKDVEKMNFKNKAHLDRINEAQARIETELATLNDMLTFGKKKKRNKKANAVK